MAKTTFDEFNQELVTTVDISEDIQGIVDSAYDFIYDEVNELLGNYVLGEDTNEDALRDNVVKAVVAQLNLIN